jgi:hypothetical protein
MNGLLLPDILIERLGSQFPDLNIWNNGDHDFVLGSDQATAHRRELLRQALDEVKRMGYDNASITFEIGSFPNAPERVAQYIGEKNVVRLSDKFMTDRDYLMSTLIEEIMHSQGYPDATRKFDQHLISELIVAKRAAMKLEALKEMVRTL